MAVQLETKTDSKGQRPIINKNALIANTLGGAAIGAFFVPSAEVRPNEVMLVKPARDIFIKKVEEASGAEAKTIYSNILNSFDDVYKPIESTITSIITKALNIKPEEFNLNTKATGKAIKDAITTLGAEIPEEIKAGVKNFDDTAKYAIQDLMDLGFSVPALKESAEVTFSSIQEGISHLPKHIFKHAISIAAFGAIFSIGFDLIHAAFAKNKDSKK